MLSIVETVIESPGAMVGSMITGFLKTSADLMSPAGTASDVSGFASSVKNRPLMGKDHQTGMYPKGKTIGSQLKGIHPYPMK